MDKQTNKRQTTNEGPYDLFIEGRYHSPSYQLQP
jgi:hypothetical protein